MKHAVHLLGVFCLFCLLGLSPSYTQEENIIRFAVISDSGTGDQHQYQLAQQMVRWHDRWPYSLVLMLGDNIYGFWWRGGRKQDFAKKFDLPYAALLRRGVVFRAALGNHDTYTRAGGDLIAAWERFHIAGEHGYYSFTAGQLPPNAAQPPPAATEQLPAPLIEFFVLNSVRLQKDRQDPAQLTWLEQALTASRARWRIAYFHHPIYSTGRRHGEDRKLRAKLEPLFLGRSQTPRVQVVLSGHDHIYERFHPRQGIVYFTVSSGKLARGQAAPRPDLAAYEDQQRTFLLIEVTPAQLRFWAINETGRAFDCAWLDPAGTVTPTPCPAPP